MSDTPRTDAVEAAWLRYWAEPEIDRKKQPPQWDDFARELERELNAALRESEEQARLLGKGGSREAALLARIAELEKEVAETKAWGKSWQAEAERIHAAMRGNQP